MCAGVDERADGPLMAVGASADGSGPV
jgi:hypothetical protein